MYPLMRPHNVHAQLVESGEWALYCDIHQWWDTMKERLPTMYPCAIKTLCIPHTSCDVEHSFSMWKLVRSEKQSSMQHGSHKATLLRMHRKNCITKGNGVHDAI